MGSGTAEHAASAGGVQRKALDDGLGDAEHGAAAAQGVGGGGERRADQAHESPGTASATLATLLPFNWLPAPAKYNYTQK